MSAGDVWQRRDGLRWVEIQDETVEPSGWRLMVPLVDVREAAPAAPLVIPIGDQLARVHLVSSRPASELGEHIDTLTPDEILELAEAVHRLVAPL